MASRDNKRNGMSGRVIHTMSCTMYMYIYSCAVHACMFPPFFHVYVHAYLQLYCTCACPPYIFLVCYIHIHYRLMLLWMWMYVPPSTLHSQWQCCCGNFLRNCFTFSAELNAKTAEAESEESLKKSKHTLLQAQVSNYVLVSHSCCCLITYYRLSHCKFSWTRGKEKWGKWKQSWYVANV